MSVITQALSLRQNDSFHDVGFDSEQAVGYPVTAHRMFFTMVGKKNDGLSADGGELESVAQITNGERSKFFQMQADGETSSGVVDCLVFLEMKTAADWVAAG